VSVRGNEHGVVQRIDGVDKRTSISETLYIHVISNNQCSMDIMNVLRMSDLDWRDKIYKGIGTGDAT